MRIGVTPDQSLPRVPPPPFPLPEARPEVTRRALPARRSDVPAEHDASLLVAALEEIQARAAALEWLLAEDLLGVCLI